MKIKPNYLIVIFLAVFIAVGAYIYIGNQENAQEDNVFPSKVSSLKEANPPQILDIEDGDKITLEASIVKKNINGREVKMLAYNGSIPGPIIKAPQGSRIYIDLLNNADVDTSLHSHGVRVDNKFDGVVGVTQDAVEKGRKFSYEIKFPDDGVFWYHPHFREDYAQELGLYGNFIVVPNDKTVWGKVQREEALFLDDILLGSDGNVVPFQKDLTNFSLMGRFGNAMLVNGEEAYSGQFKKGEVVRFYLTNSASTRVFNLGIERPGGGTGGVRIKLVGGDGGKYEKEQFVPSVIISPSERAVIDVLFEEEGEYFLAHKTPVKTYTLGKINVLSEEAQSGLSSDFEILRENPYLKKDLSRLAPFINKPADKSIKISLESSIMSASSSGEGAHMMPDGTMMGGGMMDENEKIEWEDTMPMMNMQSNDKNTTWKIMDEKTGKQNMDIVWEFKKGDVVKLKIFNDPSSVHPMQHPVHIHGQRFLVVSKNGVVNDNHVWKDTVLVETADAVELLVEMSNPGDWLLHCHIPEHMEAGMMMKFKVS